MSDEADMAQKPERLFQAEALGNVGTVGHPGFTSFFKCAECDEEIPERRRQAVPGCRLCAVCQEEQDRNSHLS